MHYDQVRFIPGKQRWFSVCKSTNVIYHINKLNIRIISLDLENALTKFNIHL